MNAQIIERDGKPEWAVLPYEEYLQLLELVEEAHDLALYRQSKEADNQETIPAAVINRLLDGENPITVWREHRGLSQQLLAQQAGCDLDLIVQIESENYPENMEILRAIAAVLGVELDDLSIAGLSNI